MKIKGREQSGTLYAEEICAPYSRNYRWIDRGEEIVDTAFAVALGSFEDTKRLQGSLICPQIIGIKSVGVVAQDGNTYLLAANFTENEQILHIKDLKMGTAIDLVKGEKAETILMKERTAVLLRMS